MVDILCSCLIGFTLNCPIHSKNLPNDKKECKYVQTYAVNEDRRLVIFIKRGVLDKKHGFVKDIHLVPCYLN